MGNGLLFDSTLCIGCQECEAACAEANGLPYDEAIAAQARASDRKYTYVQTLEGGGFMRHLCMHCEEPSCASVCPVGAFTKSEAGPVVYDESKCMGCRYCMIACPFGVPKYEWSALLPAVRKCTGCFDRVRDGKATACSEACPTGATTSGERSALIAEARRRIEESPEGYVNRLFGETEVGGTSTLLLAAVPFERFGLAATYPDTPLPALTYRVLSKIPSLTTVGFVLLGGIWWITNRRDEVARVEAREAERGANRGRS